MIQVVLFILAFIMSLILIPAGIIYKIIISLIRKTFDIEWFKRLALSLDQLCNVIVDDLFNDIMIKRKEFAMFGKEDETISSVLGKNHLQNNLSVTGEILRKVLYLFDTDHSVNAIEKDE